MIKATKPIHNGFKDQRYQIAVSTGAVMFLTAHLIASFFPSARTWGFHHWTFYPQYIRFLWFAGLLFCLPAVNRYILQLAGPLFSSLSARIKLNTYLSAFFPAFLSFPIFYLFRTRTHFLGDGYIITRSLAEGKVFIWAEPFDSFIHHVLHSLFHPHFGLTAEQVYALTSCFMGACFIFLSALWVQSLTKDHPSKVFMFLALFFMGSIQLFFGYVESYTILFLEVFVYAILSLRYLQNKSSIFFPSFLFSLAVCTHISGLILLPSLLYLYASKVKRWNHWKEPLVSFITLCLGVAVPVLILAICIVQTGFGFNEVWQDLTKGSHTLPWTAPQDDPQSSRYGLLSLTHLIDMLNEIILIAPVALLIGLSSLFVPVRKQVFRDRTSLFLMIAGGACFLYLFLMKPDKGASRDWDLFALGSVPWTMYALHLFSISSLGKERFKRMELVLIIIAILHTGPWILINSDVERSLERFQTLTEKDASWSNVALADAYEELSTYSREQGWEDQRVEYCEKAVKAMPASRYFIHLGAAYGENDRHEESITVLKKVGADSPYAADAHFNMGISYLGLNKIQEAATQFRKTLSIDPTHLRARFNIAVYYTRGNKVEEAIAEFQKILQIDPQHEEARRAIERLSSIEQDN